MAIKDGWHRIPGDGTAGDPDRRFRSPDSPDVKSVWPGENRFYYWAEMVDGQVKGVLGFLDDEEPKDRELGRIVYWGGYKENIEKFWGKTALELIDPEPSWGKVVGGAGFVLLGLSALNSLKTKAKSNTEKQTVAVLLPEVCEKK